MDIREFLVERIFNLCETSIRNISREEWDCLNQDVNNYLEENQIEEEIHFQEIFDIKPDEREQLRQNIDECFNTYPLIQTFFEERSSSFNFPPLNMINIIRHWCQDFIESFEEIDELGEIEETYESMSSVSDSVSESDYTLDSTDYITVKYFQGLFLAVYEMFMNREL